MQIRIKQHNLFAALNSDLSNPIFDASSPARVAPDCHRASCTKWLTSTNARGLSVSDPRARFMELHSHLCMPEDQSASATGRGITIYLSKINKMNWWSAVVKVCARQLL